MAKISNKQFAESLYEATQGLSGVLLFKVIEAFAAFLAKKHKLKQSEKIIKEYLRYAKKSEGIAEIEITSARELDEKVMEKIKKVFGKNTEATVKVEPEMLGCVRIKTEDKILDASLKTQLNKLKQALL